jgi:competence protein ComEA
VRALTPSERRGALVVVVLLGLGAARDLIVVRLAPRTPPPPAEGAEAGFAAPGAAAPAPAAGPQPAADPAPLDLNRATAQELDRLPGIGPVLAARILERRARAGPFRSVDELRSVRGVGPRLIERLRPRVRVDAAPRLARRASSRDVQSARERTSGAADSAQVRPGPVR